MALEQARHAGDVVRSTTQEVRERVSAVKEAVVTAAPPRVAPGAPVGPPVIPTTWLEPREQYLVAVAAIGLIEVMKAWDILSTWILFEVEPTWSSSIRVQGPISALLWFVVEGVLLYSLSLLRIPGLSPSFSALAAVLVAWNAACFVVAVPGQVFGWINFLGPSALGTTWYLSIWHFVSSIFSSNEGHISGVHRVRLLPFSTATLNPLSLNYCMPKGSTAPIYVPVIFNNSAPYEVSYFVRALDTGKAEVKVVGGSSLKRSSVKPLAITDSDDDDVEAAPDPLSALIHASDTQEIDYSRLPSIKPADSLSVVPIRLASTEQMLFIAVDRPSVISLKGVSDRRGDKFHIAPHREAVIIECPSGGDFVHEKQGQLVKAGKKVEQRCVGQEDVLSFEVRGVGAMKAAWRKRSRTGSVSGVIEGIEPTVQAIDEVDEEVGSLALVRRDKVSNAHTVPLRVSHDAPGIYSVAVTSVSDSLHNSYTPQTPEWTFDVHSRPVVKFDCPKAIQILENRTAELAFKVDSLDGPGHMGDVQVAYEYTLADGNIGGDTISVQGNRGSILAKQPGVYKLVDVSASCSGQIQEPASCRVELIPVPTVKMGVTTLHECAMDVGVTVAFDFTGQPPFIVDYTEQRNNGRIHSRQQIVQSMHGDMVLLPEQEGTYTYAFKALSDRNYRRLPVDQAPITQTIHPLATVDLAMNVRRNQLWACGGEDISLIVEAKGREPLALNYLVTSQSYASGKTRSENVTINIHSGRSNFIVPVPSELAASTGNKGKFSTALLAITDGNGCTRRLNPAPSFEVDVDRERPTARLAKPGKVILVEGEQIKAPLRLTGTAPWTVTYKHDGKTQTVTMRDANNALTFHRQGVYRLVKIRDAYCEGDVLDPEGTVEIAFKPRPRVSIVPSKAFTLRHGTYEHRGLCQEQEDQVAFRFEGEGPFELVYKHTKNGSPSTHTLKSAQNTGILHLATEPGSHRYDILRVGDSNYAAAAIPEPIAVSHEINSRPSVSFGRQNTRKLCLDSALASDAKVYFEGKAPFEIEIAIRRPASVKVDTYAVTASKNEWTLDLPQHILKDIGRHEVTITRMADKTGCEWIVHDLDRLSTMVEVVESARIVPVTQAQDLCVGDTLEFELQGTAPWSVEYRWLGKAHRVTSSASRFTRYAEKAGEFEVTSVALKDDQCKRDVSGLKRHVHPLPSVQIQDGVDDLREGDDPAVFAVHLKGTAPFSFTYTRSEVINGRAKVVDTQTISDIMENEYRISSSLPGDYQVVSVSDRYCRYPPLKGRKGS